MSNKKLKDWAKRLRTKNMPVLGAVVAELNKAADHEVSGANTLAEVILQDPTLTSHVLRVANSVQYNYSTREINTISRAIVLIGLKGMRALCISLLIIDRLLDEKAKEQVLSLIARGFHAGTQARNLVNSKDPNEKEDVFIAGLLYNLGEMSFWMSQDAPKSDSALTSTDPRERNRAIEQIIGGSFKALTRELASAWRLGPTLHDALTLDSTTPIEKQSDKVRAVIIGERISRAALYGWESPQVKKVLSEVASLKGIDLDAALIEVRKGADVAASTAIVYGASDACPLIPSSLRAIDIKDIPKKTKVLKPDTRIQLSILRELSTAATENQDVNTLFQMVLEGMHRGVGLERVVIAFKSGQKLAAKYVIGEGTDHWRSRFLFDASPFTDNVFTHAIENGPQWLDADFVRKQPEMYCEAMGRIVGRLPALLFPVFVGKRCSAVFYADRCTYGGQLSEEQFENFKHFGAQAQLSLNALSRTPVRS